MIEQEYGIKTKPYSPDNPQANTTIERIHQVLGNLGSTSNLQETYVYDADPWMGILAVAAFTVHSTHHRTKQKIPGQLVLGRDMILLIDPLAYWRYMRQRGKTQIEKEAIHKNSKIMDHDYRVGDKFMARRNQDYKYKTPLSMSV